jgi:hypothetical protein
MTYFTVWLPPLVLCAWLALNIFWVYKAFSNIERNAEVRFNANINELHGYICDLRGYICDLRTHIAKLEEQAGKPHWHVHHGDKTIYF